MIEIYMSSSAFMIVMLAILLVRIWYYIEWNQSKKYAVVFVGMVALYIGLDALFVRCFLSESVKINTFKTVVFLFYIVYVIMPYIWHLFMESYMGITCRRGVRIAEAIPLMALLGMVIASVLTGIVWGFDGDGNYIRGPFFSLFAVLNLFYYFMAYIQSFYALMSNKRNQLKYILQVSIFSALPLMGILVNTYVIPLYGVYPFQPYCLVIGALLAYLFMVEHQKSKDAAVHREKLTLALEQEKEASRKAREAGAVKDTFLANMSHDIRTPMNAILGFSDMIARNPGDEAVVRDAIAKIQASGDVLLKIINDVLDLSKIESGKVEVTETAVNLQQMAEKLEMMLEYSIEKKQIHFEIVNQLQHEDVWCDVTKMQQILVNVLNNAVKFTPEGGSVTFEMTEKVSDESLLSANAADKENAIGKENAVGKENDTSKENVIGKDNTEEKVCYVFHVKDTGIGMDEEFQKHAFEAFERERTSTESKIEGTGLGLAIVKKLVELMNGQVTIQSSRGQGTDICIALPLKLAQSGAVAESEIPDVDIDLTGERVLLVEDNELNAEIAL